jgi:hypothetical protein
MLLPDHMIVDVFKAIIASSSSSVICLVELRLVCKRFQSIVDGEPLAWGASETWIRRWWKRQDLTLSPVLLPLCLPFSPIICRHLVEQFHQKFQANPGFQQLHNGFKVTVLFGKVEFDKVYVLPLRVYYLLCIH